MRSIACLSITMAAATAATVPKQVGLRAGVRVRSHHAGQLVHAACMHPMHGTTHAAQAPARSPSQGAFLPFLPQDNSSLPDAEEATQLLGADLASLLRQPASSFWRTVGGEPSLATCLDSYLRFKRCVSVPACGVFAHACPCRQPTRALQSHVPSFLRFPTTRRVHDSPTGAPVSDESPAAVALSRRVLMVLLRL